jgi:hypothetical protein
MYGGGGLWNCRKERGEKEGYFPSLFRYICVTMARKKDKICLVCGESFKATAAGMTCSPACRTALYRILKTGKKPDFYYVAQSKGQKVPLLFKPPAKPVEAVRKEVAAKPVVEFKAAPEAAYDSPKLTVTDEPSMTESAKPLTPEEKFKIMGRISELEKKLWEVDREQMPRGMLPKRFGLYKSGKKDDIQEEIDNLKKLL